MNKSDIKILIVDDEANITDSLVTYLEYEGFKAIGAKNSKEALEAINTHKPNVLIIDINLREELTGLDVLREALKINPKAQAAMLTGLSNSKIEEDPLELGAKAILKKPIAAEKIIETINELAKNIQGQNA